MQKTFQNRYDSNMNSTRKYQKTNLSMAGVWADVERSQ